MWIRSQDKLSLIEAKRIVVNITPNSYHILDQSVNGYHVMLGAYSTEEKALKVLDEIESSIYLCEISIRTNERPYAQNLIFQMPQDEEVE